MLQHLIPRYCDRKGRSSSHLYTLANYDLFQFENNIKPDYCNAGGLEEFNGKDWLEWEDEDGDNIDETILVNGEY